jgi:sRNA-binding regulator protein Hfq
MTSFEEIFLNNLRKNSERVKIIDVTGEIHEGNIVAFDSVCVVYEPVPQGKQILLRKESVVSIEPTNMHARYILMDHEDRANGGRHE